MIMSGIATFAAIRWPSRVDNFPPPHKRYFAPERDVYKRQTLGHAHAIAGPRRQLRNRQAGRQHIEHAGSIQRQGFELGGARGDPMVALDAEQGARIDRQAAEKLLGHQAERLLAILEHGQERGTQHHGPIVCLQRLQLCLLYTSRCV